MSEKSPAKYDTIKSGIKVKGTKYNKAGCAEFMTKRLTKVAIIPKREDRGNIRSDTGWVFLLRQI